MELHNPPLVIVVRCKKRGDTQEIDNEIRGYEARSAAAGTPRQAVVAGSQGGTDGDATPPWKLLKSTCKAWQVKAGPGEARRGEACMARRAMARHNMPPRAGGNTYAGHL
ncbi:MAG: hypothetical protein R3C45_18490 [Phycisphaerales bacterium]